MDTTLAVIIGFFLPGISQIFEGDVQRGVPMFIIALILWAFIPYSPFITIAAIVYQLYSGYNAYKISEGKSGYEFHVN